MPKFRDMVRGWNQTTVPTNLRAADKPKRIVDPEGRRTAILRYIRDHDGEEIALTTLGRVAGYANPTSGVGRAIDALIAEGRIRVQRLHQGLARYHYIPVADIAAPAPDSTPDPTTTSQSTDQSKALWAWLQTHQGQPVTLNELAELVGYSSYKAVSATLVRWMNKGYLRREGGTGYGGPSRYYTLTAEMPANNPPEISLWHYLEDHQGQYASYATLSRAAGYTSPGGAYNPIRKWLKARYLAQGEQGYTVLSTPPGIPKRPEVEPEPEGEAEVVEDDWTRDPEPEPDPEPTPEPEAEPEPEPQPDGFIDRFDREAWRFLQQPEKSAYELGDMTKALVKFRDFISKEDQ